MYTMQGKTRPTWHICFPRQSPYTRRMVPAGDPRAWQPFVKSSTAMDRATAPKKKGSWHNPQHSSWPICRSVSSFSPEPVIQAVGVKRHSVDGRLLGLSGLYHRHTIGIFNTFSWASTHRSLTDTGRGYNLGGAGLSHTTPRPSQPIVSTFHLRALPGLRLSNNSLPSD
jgi:hypothetical protein